MSEFFSRLSLLQNTICQGLWISNSISSAGDCFGSVWVSVPKLWSISVPQVLHWVTCRSLSCLFPFSYTWLSYQTVVQFLKTVDLLFCLILNCLSCLILISKPWILCYGQNFDNYWFKKSESESLVCSLFLWLLVRLNFPQIHFVLYFTNLFIFQCLQKLPISIFLLCFLCAREGSTLKNLVPTVVWIGLIGQLVMPKLQCSFSLWQLVISFQMKDFYALKFFKRSFCFSLKYLRLEKCISCDFSFHYISTQDQMPGTMPNHWTWFL